MDRRSFLRGLGMMVAGVAIDQAIPLGRVWSFPSKIVRCSTVNVRIPPRFTAGDTIALQLEKVRHQLPLLFEGIPYYEVDESSGVWLGIERKPLPDHYNLRARLKEQLADDTGFRITGITVPQGE